MIHTNLKELTITCKNNPKTSYELSSHEGPASYYNKSSSNTKSIGKVEKYLPDTYYNNGPERYFTTTGVEQRPTVRSMNDSKTLEQMNNMGFYSGTQSTNGPYREPAPQTFKVSDKCDDEKQGYLVKQRNYTGDPREGDYGLAGLKLEKQIVIVTHNILYLMVLKKQLGQSAPITDVLRPSRKEDIVENYRTYGNPGDSTHSGFVNGTQQSPNVTNRDMNISKEEYFEIYKTKCFKCS